MKKLNEQYAYGLDLMLLSVDEGIAGYRDDSLEVGAPSLDTGTARGSSVSENTPNRSSIAPHPRP